MVVEIYLTASQSFRYLTFLFVVISTFCVAINNVRFLGGQPDVKSVHY